MSYLDAFSFVAFRSDGRERLPLYHNFSTNAAPSGGDCLLTPTLGYADPIQTLFNVSCWDWTDDDQPLNYSLRADYTGARVISAHFTFRFRQAIAKVQKKKHSQN